MKSKKALVSVLLVIFVSMAFFGCGQKQTGTQENVEKMTIKWLGAPYYPTSEEGTFPEKLLEEKFNIEIKPVFMDNEGYKTKKPLVMSSGDIPDLIYEMDPMNVQADARQGFLMELPYETIKEYAPSVVGEINKVLPKVWLYSYCDGKNYGIPNLFYGGDIPRLGLWRLDWLENLGITKAPETIVEMHDAFVKIVNNDPDKNGKKDTYALSGDLKSSNLTFNEIFGAYGVMPFNWMERNGEIVYGGLQPETKEVLKILAEWYKEGLIDPDFITDVTLKTITNKFKNGIVGYVNNYGSSYVTFDETDSESFISIMKKTNPNARLAVGPLPKGPEGKSGTFVWGKGGHIITFGRQLKEQPEKLKKILEILEYMNNDQAFSTKLNIGEEGIQWKLNDPSKGGFSFLPPYDNQAQRSKLLACDNLGATSFFDVIPIHQETRDKYDSKANIEHLKKYVDPKLGMGDAMLKPDTVPSSDKYFSDLKNKQLILFASIIRGEKGIEAYSEFEDAWKTEGGKELEKNANILEGELKIIYQQVGVN